MHGLQMCNLILGLLKFSTHFIKYINEGIIHMIKDGLKITPIDMYSCNV